MLAHTIMFRGYRTVRAIFVGGGGGIIFVRLTALRTGYRRYLAGISVNHVILERYELQGNHGTAIIFRVRCSSPLVTIFLSSGEP